MERKWRLHTLLLVASVAFTGCLVEEGDQGQEVGTIIDVIAPPEAPDPNTLVCNPFGEGAQPEERMQGVLAELFYLDDSQPHYRTAEEYMTHGHKVEELQMYFNQIYVPTRPFDRGFTTQSGTTVMTPTGDTLYEYFGIQFQGRLQLGPNDFPGEYQLALLSDDGSVLEIDFSSQQSAPAAASVGEEEEGTPSPYIEHINNDGNHPTKLKCGASPVLLERDSKLPFKLKYYQGPRYHISMIVLYRPWHGREAEPECDKQGNSRFFDFRADPPTPTSTYEQMLARGWKVLGPGNYLLPEKVEENPCNEVAPQIVEYGLIDVSATSVTIAWTTDIPGTSQLRWVDVATGETGETELDRSLVLDHQVVATGLKPNTVYSFTAVSGSQSGLSSESPEISLRTSR